MKPAIKALSEGSITFLRQNADDKLAAFDGNPKEGNTPEENDLLSYGGSFEHVIVTYCALREQARAQCEGLLAQLNALWTDEKISDAFIAHAVLLETRKRLLKFLEEDNHMAAMLKDVGPKVDLSAAQDTPSKKQLDRDIAKSAQAGNPHTDDDVAGSAWGTNRPDKIHDDVAQSAKGNPYKENPDDGGEEDVPEQVSRMPDVSRADPVQCYRISTQWLCQAIVLTCTTTKEQRIAPLGVKGIRTVKHGNDEVPDTILSKKEMIALGQEIYRYAAKLKPPVTDKKDELLG